MNEEEKKPETAIAKIPIEANTRGIVLRTYDDMYRFAKSVQLSHLAPDSFTTPEQILIALQAGAELGLSPIRSLGSLYVVKGNVRLWGDAPLALVRKSGLMEYIKEWIEGEIGIDLTKTDDNVKAVCETKRKGDPESMIRTFSVGEARLAGLWNKKTEKGYNTVWANYPKRMMQMRARALNLRDNFPDALGGASIAEEYEGIVMPEEQQTPVVQQREDRKTVESTVVKSQRDIEMELAGQFSDKLSAKVEAETGCKLTPENDLDILDKISGYYLKDTTVEALNSAIQMLDAEPLPQEILDMLPEKPLTAEEAAQHLEEILPDETEEPPAKRGRKPKAKPEPEEKPMFICTSCHTKFEDIKPNGNGRLQCPKCLKYTIVVADEVDEALAK